mgnify:FL=1
MNSFFKFARIMDVVTAIAMVLIAIWMVYANWPTPTGWTWVAIFGAIASIPMAFIDMGQLIRTHFLGRFTRAKRG